MVEPCSYIEYHTLYVNQTTLEFVGNSATSNGGAIFIDGKSNKFKVY